MKYRQLWKGESRWIWLKWLLRVQDKLRSGSDSHNAQLAMRSDAPADDFRVTIMEQRTMFIKDLSMQLSPGTERARHAGYVVRYTPDRQPSPMRGWWISRKDSMPFQRGEVQRLIATIRDCNDK
jgi:hypothetical protein